MYKGMAVFSLAKGMNPDEVWKYYIETHAAYFKNVAIQKKIPGQKKYVLNRVIKASGEIPFWAMAEQWYDSENAYDKFRSVAGFPNDDFHSMIGVVYGASVEEKVIIEGQTQGTYKHVALLSVAKGKDPDEVWRYWIDPHAANHKKVPGIKKYVLNRVIKTRGEFPFWGMAETWYDSEEAYNRPSSVTIPKDDFPSMIGKERITAWLEEKVII